MKTYTGKTLEEVLDKVSEETGITKDELIYIVTEEKKSLFKKSVSIDVYDLSEVLDYASNYILNILTETGIKAKTSVALKDNDIIRITVNSDHNPLVIGQKGLTLQALNELVKAAVNTKFQRRFRILLDVENYKERKYRHDIIVAKKEAKKVITTQTSVALDPMPADERKQIHNALAKMSHISTQSEGDGSNRHIVIHYKDED